MPTKEIQGDTLTEIMHGLVLRAPNGKSVKVVASTLGKGHVLLLNELNPGQDRNKFDADMVLPLCMATGSVEPVLWLARQLNLACLHLPEAGPGSGSSCRDALAAVQEFGQVIEAYNRAVNDKNGLEPHEIPKIRKEGHEAIEAILAFLQGLDAQTEEEA